MPQSSSAFEKLRKRLEGCYITIPTMFSDPDLEVDHRAVREVVRFIIDGGMDAEHGTLLAGGAAGDFSTLTFDERLRLIDTVLTEAAGTMPVAVGGQTTSTREAVQLAKRAKSAGADFLQVSCPFYFSHTEADFIEHISAIADASDIGLIIYNTFWTSSGLSYDIIAKLSEIPSVVGLKWATGRTDSMEFEEVVANFANRFCIIDNQLKFVISHMLGARAYEVHTCNYWPEWGVRLVDDLNAGRYESVQRSLIENVLPFYRLWREIESGFTSGDGYLDKLCMELVGLPSSRCRPPTRDIRERYREAARAMLIESGVSDVRKNTIDRRQGNCREEKMTKSSMHLSPIIDRRGFIAGAAASFAALAGPRAFAQEARKGGRFRIGATGGSTNDTLDPALILDIYMNLVSFGQLRNCLTEIAPDGKLVPELAESWEASKDAKIYRFKLRKGVEFHNGKTLTAEDVVSSLNHHRGVDSKSAAKDVIKSVADVKVDGDIVVVTLSDGNADFPYLMSDPHLGICPAGADGNLDWRSGIGTGGYKLDSFQPGIRTVTKRHANYWKEGAAHFDEVETLFIADVAARTNALRTAEIDVMNKVDLNSVDLMKRAAGIKVLSGPSNQHVALPMHANVAPFDNNDVRLALKYAIDREAFLKVILRGFGSVGNDHPIGPANRYLASAQEIPQRVYDLDKAKFHLKKAGLETLNVQLFVAETAYAGATDSGILYSEQAKPAGINIEVVRAPEDGYWDNVWLKKPWCASFWAGRPTEDWMFTQVYATGASWNESAWSHAKFDQLLAAARSELDEAKRRSMYVEMQRILHEEGSSVIPAYGAYVQAVSDKVKLPDVTANNLELDGGKCAERWSFA